MKKIEIDNKVQYQREKQISPKNFLTKRPDNPLTFNQQLSPTSLRIGVRRSNNVNPIIESYSNTIERNETNTIVIDQCSTMEDESLTKEEKNNCNIIARKVCIDCRMGAPTIYCDICFNARHNSRFTRNHVFMDADDYLFILKENSFKASKEDFKNDEENILCELDFKSLKLKLGRKFYLLRNHFNDQDLISVVSFVAPSGSGKSRLLRTLVDDPKPIHSSPDSNAPCSSDIHAYIGKHSINSENTPILFLDTEGTGSDVINLQSRQHRHSIQHDNDMREQFQQKKAEYVEGGYPRLTYIFSDVICVPFLGNARAYNTIIDPLISYAQSASAGSVNIATKPFLIIVLNKISPESLHDGDWSVDSTTHRFRFVDGVERERIQELLLYYSEVRVVCIPNSYTLPHQYLNQIVLFRNEITRCVEKSRTQKLAHNSLLKTDEWCSLFFTITNCLSNNPSSPINFSTIGSVIPENDDDQYLLKSFHVIQHCDLMEKRGNSLFFEHNLLSILRYNYPPLISHLQFYNSKIPDEYNTILSKLGKELKLFAVCNATQTFIDKDGKEIIAKCETISRLHNDIHLSSSTYIAKVENNVSSTWRHWFGNRRYQTMPCNWSGSFQGEDYSQFLIQKVNEILEMNPNYIQQFDIKEYIRNSIPDSCKGKVISSVCMVCKTKVPTEQFACEHYFCLKCVEAIRCNDLPCPSCGKEVVYHPQSVPQNAGIRMLSLDGGGLRTIVELMILKEIESRTGLQIYQLFDLICGTSGGGLIALSLTIKHHTNKPLTADQVFSLIKENGTSIFKRGPLISRNKRTNNLKALVKKLIGDGSMNNHDVATRVAVTSCSVGSGSCEPVVIASYNRADSEDIPIIRNVPRSIAALATSSIPNYFEKVYFDGKKLTDGGLLNNCPVKVTLHEYTHIWNDRNIDLMLSLGCQAGVVKEEYSLYKKKYYIFKSTSRSSTNIDHIIRDVLEAFGENRLEDPDALKCGKKKLVRVDPNKQTFSYDIQDREVLRTMINEVSGCISNFLSSKIDELCYNLIAKLFYVEFKFNESNRELTIFVRNRINRTNETNDFCDCLQQASELTNWLCLYNDDNKIDGKMQSNLPIYVIQISNNNFSKIEISFLGKQISGMPISVPCY